MSRRGKPEVVLIAGPTASGKSSLALDLARRVGGVVVNADSMQVYDGLRILTARPSDEDLAAAPHRLYGHVPPTSPYSVGEWARDAAVLLEGLGEEGRLPILCGGTGLYFRALLGGIDDMPAIAPDIRAYWRGRMADEGPESLHEELRRRDPAAAVRIRPKDPQRITRALEVIDATGGPLAGAQQGRGTPLVEPERALKIVLTPPRERLRDNIRTRFDAMLATGALEEARAFAAIPGALGGTAGKAIGLAELILHLEGRMDLREAADRAVTRSRQYAKRQDTWFRHQFDDSWTRIAEPSSADVGRLAELIDAR